MAEVSARSVLPGCVDPDFSLEPVVCTDTKEDFRRSVVGALDGVACDWDSVLRALEGFTLPDEVIEEVVQQSAAKLGFWALDAKVLAAARKVIQKRLAERKLSATGAAANVSSVSPTGGAANVSSASPTPQDAGGCVPSAPPTPKASPDRRPSKCSATAMLSQLVGFDRQTSGQSKATNKTTESMHLVKAATTISMTNYVGQPVPEAVMAKAKDLMSKEQLLAPNSAAPRLRQFKWAMFVFVTIQMVMFACYVVFYMTPMTWDVIGLPILIARGSAYGACFWTGVLFLTMSRDLIAFVTRFSIVRKSQLAMQLINCHKELHIFSAYELLLDGCLHALMHHIGTFVALENEDARTLNSMLVCAQDGAAKPAGHFGRIMGNFLKGIQFPRCPLPEDAEIGYLDGVLSTPGITGYLMLVVIFVLGWFSRNKKRRANFRLFYALHHLLVPCWVILLVLHGANDWVGLGFPLAILVAGIPVASYAWTRLRRAYLTCRHDARVAHVQKSATRKLLRLEVELERAYRTCQVGEYAYVCVLEAGRTEWHPYTICGAEPLAEGRQRVTFCIMSVGQWTKRVHELFESSVHFSEEWPKVYIDGPFYAPTVSMPTRSTVVGIGAGVGVTPFLSFMGSKVGESGSKHKSAHVFWMSAFATDFVLFKDLLSALEARSAVKGGENSTTFHLHATPRFGAWDGKGLGSVFELAAREIWADWLQRLDAKALAKQPSFSKYKAPLHAVVSHNLLESQKPLAVAVGSPDWITEFLAIGEADLTEHVFVYFCGNDFLKNMIQSACIACNEVRVSQGQGQRYYFYFERFG